MNNYPIPFDRSYWVVPGKLMAGCYPGSPDPNEAKLKLTGLVKAGIRHVINLMEPNETGHNGEPFMPYESMMAEIASEKCVTVTFDRYSIRDLDVPTGINMNRVLTQVDTSIQAGKPVYVHCWGGRGRTGTVVGCWLVRQGMVSGKDAVDRIRHLRLDTEDCLKPSPETPTQVQMVETWG
jgi:protein tyrosine/serine phosphatase